MSKSISYEALIEKYCLLQKDVLKITNAVLRDASLQEIQSELNGRLTQERIYVVARSICNDLVGEDINLVAPKMVKERKLLGAKASKQKGEGSSTSSREGYSSSQSAEDVMSALAELFYELK